MNLQQLYYFRAVAEFEHYTLAAGKLMVSPSSLSHAISSLEDELGLQLFRPHGRNVRLTEHGKLYLSYVSDALDTLEQGNAHMRSFVDPQECTINIAYNSSLQVYLQHLISCFLAETGNIKINFQFYPASPSMIDAGMESGTYNLAFSSHQGSPLTQAYNLGPHELVAIAASANPLAMRGSVSIADLSQEKLITYVKSIGNTRDQIDTLFQKTGKMPEIALETTLDAYIISAVAANLGVALIPRPLTPPPDNIHVLPITDAMPPRSTWFLQRKLRFTPPGEQAFIDFIVNNNGLLQEMLNAQRFPAQ